MRPTAKHKPRLAKKNLQTSKGSILRVVNLSGNNLNNTIIDILVNKGLKFTPVPRTNTTELKADVKTFCRKLRLKEFFTDKPITEDPSLVKPKSNFTPKRNRDPILDAYIDYLTKYPLDDLVLQQKPIRSNLTKKQWNAVQQLKNQNDIIIKQSDKGGACVVMDKDYYHGKMMELLNDRETYQPLNENIDKITNRKIKKLTNKYKNCLTNKEIKYSTDFDYQDSNLYGLPKIHKSKTIIEKIRNSSSSYIKVHRPNDLKILPICAGPNSVTSRLSNFVDILLKPCIRHVKSHIRDDIDFLNKLKTDTDEKKVLATFDITSMYTNINNDLGKEAINYWLKKDPDSLPRNISKEFVKTFHISYRTHMYSPYYLLLILYSLDIVLSRYRTELSLKLHDMIFSLR